MRYHTLLCIVFVVVARGANSQSEPDALYRDRVNLDRAREAVSIWDARLKTDPRDFESAWKIARAA